MSWPSRPTVLVTGANGFIGSSLVRALDERGSRVHALVWGADDAGAGLPAGVRRRVADIQDASALHDVARGADVIVHLAGCPSVGASYAAPAECARTHVAGTAAVVDVAQRARVRRLVYVSSAEVYGADAPTPVPEDHRLAPVSPYGAAKVGAEAVAAAAARASSLEAVILRPFSVFGPGMSSSSVLMTALRQAATCEAVTLADLRPVRDYCYIDDVVDAIVRACSRPLRAPLRVFNVGTGVGTSVRDLAAHVCAALARPALVRSAPRSSRPADIFTLVADAARIRTELGWRPRTPLAAGIGHLVDGQTP